MAWLVLGDSNEVLMVTEGAEFCDAHGGYHPSMLTDADLDVDPFTTFSNEDDASDYAAQWCLNAGRMIGATMLPLTDTFIDQEENARWN